jgi:tetratricopeptide (TPR) repeat protein
MSRSLRRQRFLRFVRIGIQLIHAPTDTHLWARDYERESSDILKLQAEVARAVSEEIRVQVTPEERAKMAAAASVNPAAHQEYLIGRYHLWRESEENLKQSIAHFERATELDPGYAGAYAGLAQAWWLRGMFGPMGLKAVESPSRAAARKALQLDDRLAEAYVVESDLRRLYDWDWTGAEHAVKRALLLDPVSVAAHHTYALLLHQLGRFDEAIDHIETADQLDPLFPAIQSTFGRILYRARRFDEAVSRLNRALELEPGMRRIIHNRLAELYEATGRYGSALAALQKGGIQPPDYLIARIYAREGRHGEARRMIEEIAARADHRALARAPSVYAALGDKDTAFTLLFRMAETRDAGAIFVKVDPPFDSLRSDSRWTQLLRRMNLPTRNSAGGPS